MRASSYVSASVRHSVRHKLLPTVLMFVAFFAMYFASVMIPAGPVTFAISCVALTLLWFIGLARVNDIGDDKVAPVWQARRFGLWVTTFGCVAVLLQNTVPTWPEVWLQIGLALSFATTPGHPPLWKILGKGEKYP